MRFIATLPAKPDLFPEKVEFSMRKVPFGPSTRALSCGMLETPRPNVIFSVNDEARIYDLPNSCVLNATTTAPVPLTFFSNLVA